MDIVGSESNFSDSSEEEKQEVIVVEDNVPIIPVPEYKADDLKTLTHYIQNMTTLFNLQDNDWNKKCTKIIEKWLMDVTELLLVIFYDGNILTASLAFPIAPIYDITYFLREPNQIFTVDGFHDEIIFGTIHEDIEGSLLTVLEAIYAPIFFRYDDWSENIKTSLCTSLHNFLANFTSLHYKLSGLVVLYIPNEEFHQDPSVIIKDRELVKRLETVAVHWTSQIRLCLGDAELTIPYDLICPQDEYDFWKYRCEILGGLQLQLQHEEIQFILNILQKAHSVYVKQINAFINECKIELECATSNTNFLALLNEPCLELENAKTPADIPLKLPKIMHLIRYIWIHAEHYNSKKHITGLFRALSNLIIIFCRSKIDIVKILHHGFPQHGIKISFMAVDCCLAYKEIYKKIKDYHFKNDVTNIGWDLDETAIFNHVDAFIQRLYHFIEIAEAMIVFGRYDEFGKIPLPSFGGTNGYLYENSCRHIEQQFNGGLDVMKRNYQTILDVRNQSWYKVITKFRELMKDLEEIVENLITNVFLNISNIYDGIEALCALMNYSCRKTLHPSFVRRINEIWKLFGSEISQTNKNIMDKLDKRPSYFAKYSGRALFLNINYNRLLKMKNFLLNAIWLEEVEDSNEILKNFHIMETNIINQKHKLNEDWINTLGKEVTFRLQRSLMVRSLTYPGLLECNIDRMVLPKICEEARHFEFLGYITPIHINQIYMKYDSLRITYESIITIVLDYNKILAALSDKERLLFKALIQNCDKKIIPAIYKLNWGGELSDAYVAECVRYTGQLQEFLDIYKLSNLNMVKICEEICGTPIIEIVISSPNLLGALENNVMSHREEAIKKLLNLYKRIIDNIAVISDGFEPQMNQMVDEWMEYIKKINNLLLEAFRLCAKNSLQNMYTALHGDGTIGPLPLIKMDVDLVRNKLTFMPSIEEVALFLRRTFSFIITALKLFPTIIEQLKLPMSDDVQPFYKIIGADKDCCKLFDMIIDEIRHNREQLNAYCEQWAPFQMQWQLDKDLFMRRYEESVIAPASFDENIGHYTEVANEISMKETKTSVYFIAINSHKLKNSIISHVDDWQRRHQDLLKKQAYEKINDIYQYTRDNAEEIIKKPTDFYKMKDALKLYQKLTKEIEFKESEFPCIREHFVIMEKYEIEISTAIKEMLENLNQQWVWYKGQLKDAEEMLENTKDQFKSALLDSTKQFKQDAENLLQDFLKNGPFTSAWTSSQALEEIKRAKEQLEEYQDDEQILISQLSSFNISLPKNVDLKKLRNEINLIEKVWTVVVEYETIWNEYKNKIIYELKTDEVEDRIGEIYKKLNRMCKSLAQKNWEILEATTNLADNVRRTIPLLAALTNPAMRSRHWDKIRLTLMTPFDETSPKFDLEQIMVLNFRKYFSEINDISNGATVELQIENNLKHIQEIWDTLVLDISPPTKTSTYKVKPSDNFFQILEDNTTMISSMRASPFIEPFIVTIDYWEKTLAYIGETIEVLMIVQRQWLYLDNIFTGDDIRQQMPKEIDIFTNLSIEYLEILKNMSTQKIAIHAFYYDSSINLFQKLNEMNSILEQIQFSLESYLEVKRQLFPRFYFISNDNVLEILGNSLKPDVVNQHIKKLFDNMAAIKLVKSQIGKKTIWESNGMYSDDQEYVQFQERIVIDGPVERWLAIIEKSMKRTLKEHLKLTRSSLKKLSVQRDKWLNMWPGQLCITSTKIQWTRECTRSLMHCKILSDTTPLKRLKKKQKRILNGLSEMCRKDLSKQIRLKINAIITIEIHSKDVIERLYSIGCKDVSHFEWFSQLRYYWEQSSDDCAIRQTNTLNWYGYEYTGNSGRLVITPLTDRCYITLTTALHMFRGGSPRGPAGTGKTETVKDLGKALGLWVIITCCSGGLDYKSMAKIFSGLCQTGTWGCFDEFNRINIEVLSVVAQQILSIFSALSQGFQKFLFSGSQINLLPTVGLFITMNPGYAGRTDLPDNLKSMFRPISMILPENLIIAENLLFSDGFQNTKLIAKKIIILYDVALKQLSKQFQYDFALRAIVSLIRYAGRKRRQFPNINELEIICISIEDLNLPKLTADDYSIFKNIVADTFPDIKSPILTIEGFSSAIEVIMRKNNLQAIPTAITKIIELYKTKTSRHSVMILGEAGTAKSVTWKILKEASLYMTELNKTGWTSVIEYPINPKALTLAELYGEYDLSTGEWLDGVLSSIMRNTCSDPSNTQKWILFDGPVDAVWIENMNSLMDDNKLLTLVNSERISLLEQVSLLFEVDDLSLASPATVSRCGIIYNDYKNWGWRPYVNSWLSRQKPKSYSDELDKLFDRFLDKVLKFKRTKCNDTIQVNEINSVISLCKLLEGVMSVKNHKLDETNEGYLQIIKCWFLFCLIWSVCATLDERDRLKIDNYLRELDGIFPTRDTVFDFYVDMKENKLVPWKKLLNLNWRYNKESLFHEIYVPTIETIRYSFLVSTLMTQQFPVILVGPSGGGKSSIIESVINKFDTNYFSYLRITVSPQITSEEMQQLIENKTEKRSKGVFGPMGGRKMICFLDDFNSPNPDEYDSQPPLELLRQWFDYGFFYDRKRQYRKYMTQIQLVASMGPPGGGRQKIPSRLLNKFNIFHIPSPTEETITQIFGTMLRQHLEDFSEEAKKIGNIIVPATIALFFIVSGKLLPTPIKPHYMFSLRDLSRIFQGLLLSHKDYHFMPTVNLRLWIHECFRVFNDRLIDETDQNWFTAQMNEIIGKNLDQTLHSLCAKNEMPIFATLLSAHGFYEDIELVPLKNYVLTQIDSYNNYPGVVKLDLVFFQECLEQIVRIIRVLSQDRGHLLLLGLGGSGRKSLTNIAAFICEMTTFQVPNNSKYKLADLREDLKSPYTKAGVNSNPFLCIFNDSQIIQNFFVEIINNILCTGEIPNLLQPDEIDEIKQKLIEPAKKAKIQLTPEHLYNFFIERIRNNFHILICMSPFGDAFQKQLRKYPALINYTTISWFKKWPEEALIIIAHKYLSQSAKNLVKVPPKAEGYQKEIVADLSIDDLKKAFAEMFASIHMGVYEMSNKMLLETKIYTYVTSLKYLEILITFQNMLSMKQTEILEKIEKFRRGLLILEKTGQNVAVMSDELKVSQEKILIFQQECEIIVENIEIQTKEVDERKNEVALKSVMIAQEEQESIKLAEEAQADLDVVMPFLMDAMRALDSLNKKDLSEVKSYGKPPAKVEKVLEAVMILLGKSPNWAEAKRQLGEQNFLNDLKNYDKNNVTEKVLKKIQIYTKDPELDPEKVGIVSTAAKSLCLWVRAIERYAKIYKVVGPKQKNLENVLTSLHAKQEQLQQAQNLLSDLNKQLEDLTSEYANKMEIRKELKLKADNLKMQLERAVTLVNNLAGEKVRWMKTVEQLDAEFRVLPGDCFLASAFVTYMGPFVPEFRNLLMKEWHELLQKQQIKNSYDFTIITFLGTPIMIQEWNAHGLPADKFSTENAITIVNSIRWPLIIDPQYQAHSWIKNIERKNDLKIIDFNQKDFVKILENYIFLGKSVLLQNITEQIDQIILPILRKDIFQQNNQNVINFNDQTISYNLNFRFYVTTNMSNPHFPPEIVSMCNTVNFVVKEDGLEAQLLGVIVKTERPSLEEQKINVVSSISSNKKMLINLENDILRLLGDSKKSILEDDEIYSTLQSSKKIASDVTASLELAEVTEKEIDNAREVYRESAVRASILFFVLIDIAKIDVMYQFSLASYVALFVQSIERSAKSQDVGQRIINLNDFHTYSFYKHICRALFESHKLLFAFLISTRILDRAGRFNRLEYEFLLRGGNVVDHSEQMENPNPSWITETAWDCITELDKLPDFHGIANSFEQYGRQWFEWYSTEKPERFPLIGDWKNVTDDLRKMLFIKSLRPDRIIPCVTQYVISYLGLKFTEMSVIDMKAILNESTAQTPLIFILSSGVDPGNILLQLAKVSNMMENYFTLSLGQGQSELATQLIYQGIKEGNWVFLANCHLSISWMTNLEKIIEQLQFNKIHPKFRLWLSTCPYPTFPITILQNSIKITLEPPQGVKTNLKNLYSKITDDMFAACKAKEKYKKLLFCLCFFHAIILERRKFKHLGWNIIYGFNESDFEISESLLSSYLDEFPDTPWDVLRYLIADINYGGHITNEWDKRVVKAYIKQYFRQEALTGENYRLADSVTYYVPKDGTLQNYQDYICLLPNVDVPEVFGQHPNADISYLIGETKEMFNTLGLLLQQNLSTGQDDVKVSKITETIDDILSNLAAEIDYGKASELIGDNPNPLDVVLLQEISRYNLLLNKIKSKLLELKKAILGVIVMSGELEEIYVCIFEGKIPECWLIVYPSLKPLPSWIRDLNLRVEFFNTWAITTRQPLFFWLSAFTFPAGILTASLQISARNQKLPIDMMSWNFYVMSPKESKELTQSGDGIYVRGLFLEGAGWDIQQQCLTEPNLLELILPMPVIHFIPIRQSKKKTKAIYQCPCYYYPNRANSFVITVDLKTTDQSSDHWIKRGTALLLTLSE